MNECCMNFLGVPISHPDAVDFSRKTMLFMREVLEDFQEETGNIYNLEATPAESAAYRFALLDTQKHRDIIVANMEDFKNGAKPYYTNSTHLPVNQTDDLFEALSVQDALQTLYTGGTVFHIFTGESRMSENAAKIQYAKFAKISGCRTSPYPRLSASAPRTDIFPANISSARSAARIAKYSAGLSAICARFHNGTTASAKNFSIENYSIKAYPNANLTSRNAKHANRRIRKTKLHRLGWKIGCGSFHARLQLALFLLPQPFPGASRPIRRLKSNR